MNHPVVVLVRPQAYGNIGAIARSMANFGFSEIRVVGEIPQAETGNQTGNEISQSDWALATPRGHEILKNLRIFSDLESAIGDCHLIIGTSGKKEPYHGGFQRPVLSPEEGFTEAQTFARAVAEHVDAVTLALVFGPEDDGLSAQEAGFCDLLLHIPTAIAAPSMNLAMAASLIFYAWHNLEYRAERGLNLKAKTKIRHAVRGEHATAAHMESLVRYVLEALTPTQFYKLPDPESTKARLRRVLRAWRLNQGDLLFVFEIFYQLKCWGQQSFEGRDFLNK